MSATNVKAYEASTADWNRLHAYAKRVARQTRKPLVAPIEYTVTEYRTVERETVHKFGPFGLFKRAEIRSERKPFRRNVPVIGQHWVLDARHHHIEKNVRNRGSHYQETTYEKSTYLLLPDGALKYVAVWEEEAVHTGDGGTRVVIDTSHHVKDIGDWELKTFDFEKRYSEHGVHGRGTKTWGDREPGRKLLVHTKGVGLSLALKRLL